MPAKEDDVKAEPEEVTDEMLELSLKSKKKKKKSKKTEDNIEDDGADDSNIKEDAGDGSISFSNNDGGDEPAEDDDFGAMDLTKKKKKKKKQKESDDMDDDDVIIDDDADESNEPRSSLLAGGALPWEGSDRDYTYEEMLERVYSILNDNNPMLRGEKKRYVLKPPEVMREGTKKSVFVNFTEICKLMHRPVDHVLAFLLTELGTSGSLDGSQRLIVKGRFQPRSFEHVLRRYIVEYVSCHSCRSPDTTLTKESANRLYFLHCNSCSATRSVAPIKQGYMAQIGRRRRM